MQNATLPADEMAKEKRRHPARDGHESGRSRPTLRARRLFETAYTRSPYRFTVIGYPDIFNEVQRDDVFAYYREKYAPNNLFFVVVGDVKADEVEKQIRDAFAKTKARAMPPVCPAGGTEADRGRAKSSRKRPSNWAIFILAGTSRTCGIRTCRCWTSWRRCSAAGRSSRLYQEVREKKGLVNSVDAWTYSPGNPGLFGMSAIVDRGQIQRGARGDACGSRAHENRPGDRGGTRQSSQAIHCRALWPAAKPCKARRRIWAETGWPQTI